MLKITEYKTLIFDFDGVLINSNKIKSNCFRDVSKKYGKDFADKLVLYHQQNGGISRHIKFKYFFDEILKISNYDLKYQDILKQYSNCVVNKIIKAEKFEQYNSILNLLNHKNLHIVSGSDQDELIEITKLIDIRKYFNNNIYGSPKNKDKIFKENIINKKILFPALYFGDSKYDYISSSNNNIDFIFISSWTELSNWEDFCRINKIPNFNSLKEFISSINR